MNIITTDFFMIIYIRISVVLNKFLVTDTYSTI